MVMELTTANFGKEVLESATPVLVDFWAPWCGPCRMMAPILEQVAAKVPGVKITKLNTDDNQDLAGEFRITGIPCLILFKNGAEIDRYIGVQPAAALEANLKKHI